MAPVASDVSLEFLPPEIFIALGSGCVSAAIMPVPETAMDEYHCSALRENKIGRARQPTYMKSISKTSREKKRAKYPFWPGVLPANAGHHPAALRIRRNTHGMDQLPHERLRKWQLRIFASHGEQIKTNTGNGDLENTTRFSQEKPQEEAHGS